MTRPLRRCDFALFFDVADGNPNGDPDADNQPRVDPETGHGLVTDVALKRLVRDWVARTQVTSEGRPAPGCELYVKEGGALGLEHRRAYEAVGAMIGAERPNVLARQWMCRQFFDVRTFGAVMTMGRAGRTDKAGDAFWNCGQVRGPVQLTFARSIDPIFVMENTLTRVAVTNVPASGEITGKQLARKYTVPYALYRAHGFFSPQQAATTDFTADDLELFWQALFGMFEHSRSASRGLMSTVALVVFEHASALGDAPAARLFQRVTASARASPPRSIADYELRLDDVPLDAQLVRVAAR